MIALFKSRDEAQRYCDERSKAHGCPVVSVHPRTGREHVTMAQWGVPLEHEGRYAVVVDESGPKPVGVELVERLEIPETRLVQALKATPEEAAEAAKVETDAVAMSVLLEKITPEQAAVAAREQTDTDMQIALLQKEEEVYLWLKNRKY